MNTSQDIKMQLVDDNVRNQVRHNAVPNDGNEVGQNVDQNPGIHIIENMNGLSVIAQEEESRIQSTQEEFEFMTAADSHEEIKRVKVYCTSEDILQQASTSGTQSDNTPFVMW
ncbi:hypothetical protein Tco_0435774 [Tanacetum coccineum]